MNKFWLFFGITLVCSGIGATFGIILIIFYLWKKYRKPTDRVLSRKQKLVKIFLENDAYKKFGRIVVPKKLELMKKYDDKVLDEMK